MDVVIRNLIHDDADGEGGSANAASGAAAVQTDSDGMIDFAALLETNEDWAAINPLPSTGRETLSWQRVIMITLVLVRLYPLFSEIWDGRLKKYRLSEFLNYSLCKVSPWIC